MVLLFLIRVTEWKELFIRFTVGVFCETLLICVCASFPFGFGGCLFESNSYQLALVSDHCLPLYCTARDCCLIRQNLQCAL